jgi:hypothetical protein
MTSHFPQNEHLCSWSRLLSTDWPIPGCVRIDNKGTRMILSPADRLPHPVSECWLQPTGEANRRAESGDQVVVILLGTVEYAR